MNEVAAASSPTMTAPAVLNPAQRTRLIIASAAFLGAFILYYLTCAPGVVWQDSAMFQYRLWKGDLKGELGLALAHPLYILLGQFVLLFNPADPAFSLNLTSVICATFAVTICIDLLYLVTRSVIAASVGAISLAVSHTFWLHAVIAEVYDFHALFLLAELWMLQHFFERRTPRWFYLAVLLNGLAFSNHVLAVLHLPIYAAIAVWAVRKRVLKARGILFSLTLWTAGTIAYTSLIIMSIVQGQAVGSALRETLMGPPDRESMVLITQFSWLKAASKAFLYFALNFPTPIALLAPVGACFACKSNRLRPFALVALGIFTVDFVFAFRYLIPDQFVFFSPAYTIFALFIGIGVLSIVKLTVGKKIAVCLLALLPALVYEVVPSVCRKANVSLGGGRDIPYRDLYTYFLRPRKNGEIGAEKFARAALRQAAPNHLIVADSTFKNVLVYVRDVLGIERNVVLHDDPDTTPQSPCIRFRPENIYPFADRGQAWCCSNQWGYAPDWILDRYDLIPTGVLYWIKPRIPATQPALQSLATPDLTKNR